MKKPATTTLKFQKEKENSILSKISWKDLNTRVAQEQKNREVYTPTISVFRWWARRPHLLIGSILDAAATAMDCIPRVSDPFSGGGTVALEAAQRGFPVYAQDLYPWPTFSLLTSLSPVSLDEFDEATERVLSEISNLRKHFRRRDGRELTHVIRVRTGKCPSCEEIVHLFPTAMICLASRSKSEEHAFWGCQVCGYVEKGERRKKSHTCSSCRSKCSPDRKAKRRFPCPHCNENNLTCNYLNGMNDWEPILVQESILVNGHTKALVRTVEDEDPVKYALASGKYKELRIPIPDGLETRRLLTMGFRHWGDIYTEKQAGVILKALNVIKGLSVSGVCKDRLALAVIGTSEMAAFLCRWDRFHLKVYESVANHRYAHTTLAVETNLLGPLGRGTLHRRLKSARDALIWTNQNVQFSRNEIIPVSNAQRRHKPSGIKIATGDSSKQGLRSGTIDLVLTDPPYYDDVQYGELARLFHFWLSQYKHTPLADEKLEAVPNRTRGRDDKFYESKIKECLTECYRILSEDGKLILTFHNREMAAWEILCRALIESGFFVSALAVARVENSADLTKRNGKALLHDIVLECQKKPQEIKMVQVFYGKSPDEKVMVAMGQAMAETINSQSADNLKDVFQAHLKKQNLTGGKNRVGKGFSKILKP